MACQASKLKSSQFSKLSLRIFTHSLVLCKNIKIILENGLAWLGFPIFHLAWLGLSQKSDSLAWIKPQKIRLDPVLKNLHIQLFPSYISTISRHTYLKLLQYYSEKLVVANFLFFFFGLLLSHNLIAFPRIRVVECTKTLILESENCNLTNSKIY